MRRFKNILTYSLVLCCFAYSLSSCKKEDALEPSYLDKDWYTLEDSDDPIDHLRYEIYAEFGVPVFYNDTIGSRYEGIGIDGLDIIYYEVLDPNYTLGTYNDTATGSYSDNDEEIETGLKFVRDYVFPRLDTYLYPRCFLLADTIMVSRSTSSYLHEENVYRGMMVTLIGMIDRISAMSEDEKYALASSVLADQWATLLMSEHYSSLDFFFNVSSEEVDSDGSVYYSESREGYTSSYYLTWKAIEEYGFIEANPDGEFIEDTDSNTNARYLTPDMRGDLVDYLFALINEKESDFLEKYADYEYVLRKYELLKGVLEDIKLLY